MRTKDFLIALPLNLFFSLGMLYLRIRGAFTFWVGTFISVIALASLFLIESGDYTANIFALYFLEV